jgi:hypothetical protein
MIQTTFEILIQVLLVNYLKTTIILGSNAYQY